jgi:phenylacetate-coenzyme A ligase PaaK-like adenylate-forming protein
VHPFFARQLYFAAQAWRGEPVARVLSELERSQFASADELRAIQSERLLRLMREVGVTVPAYRERFAPFGASAEDWLAAFERLPVLDKRDLQHEGARFVSLRAPRGAPAATSGSSGTPIVVQRSHASWAHAHANVFRGWHWHGLQVGDPYAYFWGLALDASGRAGAGRRDAFFNRRRLSAFERNPERIRTFYDDLRRHPARFAFGYPSAVTQFADAIADQGLDGRALQWRAVITTAEVLKPHQREQLAGSFECVVVDSYGCAEVGVTGFECPYGTMHVPVESVVVETIPRDDGLFEVVMTDLFNVSQPIVRYRIGDLVEAPLTWGRCACGRALPSLGRIHGRAGDTIRLPDGRQVNPLLPYYIFRPHAKSGRIREYQFAEFPDGRIVLRVLPGPAWTEELAGRVAAEVSAEFGLPVSLEVVEAIDRRGRGKHRDYVRVGTDEGN